MATGRIPINGTAAIQSTIVDAKGDLIAATGADAVARLAVGSNDQILVADSSTATGLKWAAASSGGMTLISTTTLSGASVTLSSIPATYNKLCIVVRNFLPATDATNLAIRFNADSNANRHATKLYGTAAAENLSFDATQVLLSQTNSNAVTNSIHYIEIPDYANTATYKIANINSLTTNSTTTTNYNFMNRFGYYNQTAAISSLQFLPGSGNFTSGTVLLYGVS